LAIRHVSIRTGDRGFGAQLRPRRGFVSVAKFGGSDSLLFRSTGRRVSAKPNCEFESPLLRHPGSGCRDFPHSSTDERRKTRDSAGFWRLGSGEPEPETAGLGLDWRYRARFSLLASWAVRFRSGFASRVSANY
jgi:hypothetical protein